MLKLQSFVFNPLQENTYVLFDDTKECVVIDPGCCDVAEQHELRDFIDTQGLTVKMLLNTHGHIDHVLGNAFVKNTYNAKLCIGRHDAATLKAASVYAPHYGFFQYVPAEPDVLMEEGQALSFGQQQLRVLFVPGHAPGHVAFYCEAAKTIIGGDVLFYNSIGRTDLPGGDFDTLIRSIHTRFFTLPDDVTVWPGHGPETTIGYEKRTNPYCAVGRPVQG